RLASRVVDVDLVVDVPAGRGDEHAEDLRARAGGGEPHVDIVTGDAAAEIDVSGSERRVAADLCAQQRCVMERGAVLLQAVQREMRAIALHDVDDYVEPTFGFRGVEAMHDHAEPGVTAELDRDAGMLRDASFAAR